MRMLVGFLKTNNFYILSFKFYIYYLAGYPVSGKIIGRISGKISIRYNFFKVRTCSTYIECR